MRDWQIGRDVPAGLQIPAAEIDVVGRAVAAGIRREQCLDGFEAYASVAAFPGLISLRNLDKNGPNPELT